MKKYAIIIVTVILVAVISVAAIVSINASKESSNTRGNNKPDSSPSRIGEETLQYPGSNNEYEYKVYETYVEIVYYTGINTDITIPNEIDGLPVKVIGPRAFYEETSVYEPISHRNELTSVVLPKNLVVISEQAFFRQSLKEISFPDSVLTIGDSAFIGNDFLSNVKFGKCLTEIGEYAFHNCNLRGEIILPNGLLHIGEHAFDIEGDTGWHNDITYYYTSSYVGQAKLRGEATCIERTGPYPHEIDLSTITLIEPGDATIIVPPSVAEIGSDAFFYQYKLIAEKGSETVQYIYDSQHKSYSICDSVDQYYK
ncbi:MAG: leucine-rich repeat domain-containing protein [Candidatus Fimenecus sp.]